MSDSQAARHLLLIDVATLCGGLADAQALDTAAGLARTAQDAGFVVALTYPDTDFFCAAVERSGFKAIAACFDMAQEALAQAPDLFRRSEIIRQFADFAQSEPPGILQCRATAQQVAQQAGIIHIFPRRAGDWHNHLAHVATATGIPGENTTCLIDEIRVLFVSDGHALCRDVGQADAAIRNLNQKFASGSSKPLLTRSP